VRSSPPRSTEARSCQTSLRQAGVRPERAGPCETTGARSARRKAGAPAEPRCLSRFLRATLLLLIRPPSCAHRFPTRARGLSVSCDGVTCGVFPPETQTVGCAFVDQVAAQFGIAEYAVDCRSELLRIPRVGV